MRILVISHSYYPANNPRAIRWRAVCESWAQNGITVDVVCAYFASNTINPERLNQVTIYRSRDPLQRARVIEPLNSLGNTSLSLKIKIKISLYAVLKKIMVLLRWPDYAWFWIPKAYQQTKRLLKTHHYDGVYSISHPFSSHVVALLLRHRMKNIPWITDYGDPFSLAKESPINNNGLYAGLNNYIDRLVIRSSKKTSVTTVETARKFVAQLGVCEEWVTVIPPLVRCGYFFPSARKTREETISLIFAGTLYAAIRNPGYFLELLSNVRNKLLPRQIEIHFYGSIGDCEQEFEPYKTAINSWIFLHGTVNQSQLKDVYERADVLVNIGNSTSYQTPSKVIEYMSTGLPILNMTSVYEDSSIPILESYPAAMSLYEGDKISELMVNNVRAFLEGACRVDIETVNKIVQQYNSETIANTYLRLLTPCQ